MKAFLLVCLTVLSGCSQAPPSPNDIAAVDALNKWWKESNRTPPPKKPGTVTPASTYIWKGKVQQLRKHVQTVKEAQDEAVDAVYMEHRQALIRGFRVRGKTATALTNLTRDSVSILDHNRRTNDAQSLCQALSSFEFGKPTDKFGLENIEIVGTQGELLSSPTDSLEPVSAVDLLITF